MPQIDARTRRVAQFPLLKIERQVGDLQLIHLARQRNAFLNVARVPPAPLAFKTIARPEFSQISGQFQIVSPGFQDGMFLDPV